MGVLVLRDLHHAVGRRLPSLFPPFFKVCLILSLLLSGTAMAADEPTAGEDAKSGWHIKEWKIQTSVYTKHWDPEDDHVNNQHLINVEAVFDNNWLAGAAQFDNSFGQSSQFVYMGKTWQIFGSKYFYWKLMGGLLNGYDGEHEDDIPLNGLGIAPAILPAIGFRYKWAFTELNIAGTAAITITAGIAF